MNRYTDFTTEHRRLAILQILAQGSGYEQNEDMISMALDSLGLGTGPDILRRDLEHLKMEVCVDVACIGDLWKAKLTRRGGAVARGAASATGVAKPLPGR